MFFFFFYLYKKSYFHKKKAYLHWKKAIFSHLFSFLGLGLNLIYDVDIFEKSRPPPWVFNISKLKLGIFVCMSGQISYIFQPFSIRQYSSFTRYFLCLVLKSLICFLRGGVTIKNGKIWEKFPKGGGLKKQTKIPNFNLGILKTQGGVSIFQKCLN